MPRGFTGDYEAYVCVCVCVCVIVVIMRGWADVGLWAAVCFLAKISLNIHVCTLDTVTGN